MKLCKIKTQQEHRKYNVMWTGMVCYLFQAEPELWEYLIPPKVQVWEDFRKKAQVAKMGRISKSSSVEEQRLV